MMIHKSTHMTKYMKWSIEMHMKSYTLRYMKKSLVKHLEVFFKYLPIRQYDTFSKIK